MPAAKKTTRSASSVQAVKKTVKAPVKKTVAKAEKVVAASVRVAQDKKTEKVASSLTVRLFDSAGKEKGTVKLPESVFGGKINNVLMAQAVRVYLANQRMGSAVAQTRGEVDGSTRKIYRQKGTGRARHGGIRAPIFVGGGAAHGPKARDYSLEMPSKMKKAAVVSALSEMAKNGKVVVVANFESITKTKAAASALKVMGLAGKKALLVMPEYKESVLKAARNIDRVFVATASMLNTYEVLNGGTVVVMQETLPVLEKIFKKENK